MTTTNTHVGATDVSLASNRYAVLDWNYNTVEDFEDFEAIQVSAAARIKKKKKIESGSTMEQKRSADQSSSVHGKKMKKKKIKDDVALDRYVESIMKDTKGIDDDGLPIDKQVLKKYLQQVKESEGFDIRDFPGVIDGVTSILPRQNLLDNPKRRPEEYEKVMYLAARAVAVYNKKNNTRFKFRNMEKLNVMLTGPVINYYVTFSGVEATNIKGPNLLRMLIKCFKLILMLVFTWIWCFFSLQLEHGFKEKILKMKMEHYLEDLTAPEDKSASHKKTFQALVTENLLDVVENVTFCNRVWDY